MNKEIEIYSFEDKNIRVVGTFENPLFAVKDICNILEIANVTMAVKNIPDKWKGVKKFLTPSGEQEMLCVNEAGLYKLVMRSTKPIAEKFQEWVCEEVLPSIRKKGEFILEEYRQKLEVVKEKNEEYEKKLENQQKQLEDQGNQVKKLNILLKTKEKKKHKIGQSVYIVENSLIKGIFKVGKTNDINIRLNDYKQGSPEAYEVLYHRLTKDMSIIESMVLCILDEYRCESEYRRSGKREWIKLDSSKIIEEINAACDFIEFRKSRQDPNSYTEVKEEEIPTEIIFEDDDEERTTEIIFDDEDEEITEILEINRQCRECLETFQLTAENFRKINQYSYRTICLVCENGKIERKCIDCKERKILSTKNFRLLNPYSFFRTCLLCELKKIKTLPSHIKQHGDINNEIKDKDKSKTCSKCKKLLSIEDFHKNKSRSDGHDYNCKNCESKRVNTTTVRFVKKPKNVADTHAFCSNCEQIKFKNEFCKAPNRKNGVQCYCKDCANKITKISKKLNRINGNLKIK